MYFKFFIVIIFSFNMLLSDVSDGYTLFTITTGPAQTTYNTQLIDNDYQIINEWNSDCRPASMAYLLPDSTLVYPCQQEEVVIPGLSAYGGRIIKYDWHGNILWDWECEADYQLHHDIEPLPNGNILAIASEIISPFTKADVVLEINPILGSGNDAIVWDWHVWDHRGSNNPHKFDEFAPFHTTDWNHFNSIHVNQEVDKIYLSSRVWSEFYIIELGGDSDILYRWGNPQNYGRGGPEDQILDANHGVNEILAGYPGQGNILIFNNRTSSTAPDSLYSSVMEIVPPLDDNNNYYIDENEPFGPTDILWQFEDGFHAPQQSGAFRLINGNTLITDKNDGRIFEVTYDGETVWEYQTEFGQINRSQKYPINYFQLLGDLNNDNNINVLDVVQLINIILNQSSYLPSADLNLDSQLNVLDVVSLINLILSQ